ncbi:alpha/beta hydrolase [Acinetobacter sp. SAAs474]|uniref:alpha/beta hydrolase n=1 Tax=Acinetobacter sp. SAAs474 TaxID=3036710 RepID=UPI002934E416|nr:alpha/beta hydrolase [Acinetobacter sp. SAAs474]WOE39894.1 alpha/beta hydrolase [Acinetobacter sp. SAAs474]
MRFLILCVVLSIGFNLTGCQSVEKSSKIIATGFNTATQVQKVFLNYHAPDHIGILSNILYMRDPNLSFDFYQAQNIQKLDQRPTIIWIHGGGWISGSKTHASGYFKLLANEGYNVIAIEYQFAPQNIYPTQLQQINQLLNFITEYADDYGININHLYLAGDSAGANLASHYAGLVSNPAFAQQSNFKISIQASQIKGLILHCGIYNLQSFVETAPEQMKLFEWGINNLVQAYTGNRKNDLAFLSSISPQHYLSAHYPPVLISGGNHDFLTKTQAIPFVEQLKSKKVPVTTLFYPNSKELLVHEYQFMMSKKASQETFKKTIGFIQETN